MRYIDAERLAKDLMERWNTSDKKAEKEISEVLSSVVTPILANAPTEDVQPVVHAHWEFNDLGRGYCSRCKSRSDEEGYFCPHCGAKMDEEEKE